jgi:hypothetical protein
MHECATVGGILQEVVDEAVVNTFQTAIPQLLRVLFLLS